MWALFAIKINDAKNMLLCSLIFSILNLFIHYMLWYESSMCDSHLIHTPTHTLGASCHHSYHRQWICNDTSNATPFYVLRSFSIPILLSPEMIGFVTFATLSVCVSERPCRRFKGIKLRKYERMKPLHHNWTFFNPRLLLTPFSICASIMVF